MSMRSAWAARHRLAAVVLAGSLATAAIQLAGGSLAVAAPVAVAAAAAPQSPGTQPTGSGGGLGAIAVLNDIRGGGGPLVADSSTGNVYIADNGLQLVNPLTGNPTSTGIPLPGFVSALGVDSATGTVYAVTTKGIAVISEQSQKVTTTVTDSDSPSQIAVDPATDTVYVTDTSDDSVTVIDGATNTVTTTVSIGHPLTAIAADPATGTIYAASSDGTVSVIDGATNKVTTTISAGTGEDTIAVNPQTDLVYSGGLSSAIAVIDGSTNTVTATINAGAAGLAVDPRTDTIYDVDTTGGTAVFNGRTNTLITVTATAPPSFPPPGDGSSAGISVAVDPRAGTIYSNYSVQEEFGGVQHLQVIGSCPSGITISPGPACTDVAADFQASEVSFFSAAHGVVQGSVNSILGGSAALVATADTGKHWTFLPAPPIPSVGDDLTEVNPTSVLFTSATDGWLYGAIHTSDGGATWQQQPPVPQTHAISMATNATTIYAAARLTGGRTDGLFTRPVDGTTWTRVPGITAQVTGLAVFRHSVWVISASHLWATTDGRHWHHYPARCPGPRYHLDSVTATSPTDVAFLCLGPSQNTTALKEVLTSANGGRTVQLAGRVPAPGDAEGFASPPGNPAVLTITALGRQRNTFTIYRSANHGRTWTTTTDKFIDAIIGSSVVYTSRVTGWMTVSGQLMHTTDAGRTWHKVGI